MKKLGILLLLIGSCSALQLQSQDESFCRQCCSQGRWTTTECCKRCNSCDMYSDEAKSECLDYPA